jgi:hypothetical protein
MVLLVLATALALLAAAAVAFGSETRPTSRQVQRLVLILARYAGKI